MSGFQSHPFLYCFRSWPRIASHLSHVCLAIGITLLPLTFSGVATASYPPPVPTDVPDEPQRLSTPTLINSGTTAQGTDYQVYVYDSDQGLCFDVYTPADDSTDGACGLDIPPTMAFNAAVFGNTEKKETIVYGPADPAVARLEFTVPGAAVVSLIPGTLPGRAVDYFVGEVQSTAEPLTLKALDAAGKTQDSWTEPVSPDVNLGENVDEPTGTAIEEAEQASGPDNFDRFSGSCTGFAAYMEFDPPVYGGEALESRYTLSSDGTCTGKINGLAVTDAPVAVNLSGRGHVTGCIAPYQSITPEGTLTFTNGTPETGDDVDLEAKFTFATAWAANPDHLLEVAGNAGGDGLGTARLEPSPQIPGCDWVGATRAWTTMEFSALAGIKG
jgi:hypothetical protein